MGIAYPTTTSKWGTYIHAWIIHSVIFAPILE